jgi:hypothetical protein
MNFYEKLDLLKTKEFLAKNDYKFLSEKFKIFLKIPYFDENIIKKIFYFYLLKFDFSIPDIKDPRDYLLFLSNKNIIDNILLSSFHNIIFLNIIFTNTFLICNKDKDIVKDIVIKITYLDNSKEILSNFLEKIFINNYLSETFIDKIFKIFNYNDFKKYQILNIVPKEFLFIFIKIMNKNKINQDLFLVQDDIGNTVFHNILNYDIKISFIKPIWQIIKKTIKNKLYKITNKKGESICDLMKKYNINLC